MSILAKWKKTGLFTKIMIGFVLGIAVGIIMGEKAAQFNFLGTILTKLLTMVVAPLVLCVIVNAIAGIGTGQRLGRIGLKSIFTFLITTLMSILLGLVMSNLIIGKDVTIPVEAAAAAEEIKNITVIDTILNIVPSNIFQSLAANELLQIIFFAITLGFALLKMGEAGEPLRKLFVSGQEAMQKVTEIVLRFTPIGVFGLMANVIGKNGLSVLKPYAAAIAAVYISSFICLVVLQAGLVVGGFGKISPLLFLKEMKEAMAFVFSTCSSVATIPLTLKATKNLGVDDDTANFVVPLGAVINMNGTAIYQAVAVIFTARVFGIELTVVDQLVIMLTATLAAIGTAGIPGSGLVMLTIVLGAGNLPMAGVGLLAGIDRIMNMGRVVPNIVGDAAAAVVVARSEGTLLPSDQIKRQE